MDLSIIFIKIGKITLTFPKIFCYYTVILTSSLILELDTHLP